MITFTEKKKEKVFFTLFLVLPAKINLMTVFFENKIQKKMCARAVQKYLQYLDKSGYNQCFSGRIYLMISISVDLDKSGMKSFVFR